MSVIDKMKNRFQMAKGRGKEKAGRQSGDPYLESEGRADRIKGGGKQIGEQAKDTAREVRRTFNS